MELCIVARAALDVLLMMSDKGGMWLERFAGLSSCVALVLAGPSYGVEQLTGGWGRFRSGRRARVIVGEAAIAGHWTADISQDTVSTCGVVCCRANQLCKMAGLHNQAAIQGCFIFHLDEIMLVFGHIGHLQTNRED